MPLTTNLMRQHNRAVISGKRYSSRNNKRVKKQNSYTFKTSLDCARYGLIDFLFLQKIIFGSHCSIRYPKGIPYSISPDDITLESQSLLFEGYFTYKEESVTLVFAKQITEKCINLSSKLLTVLLNNTELE